MNGVGSAGSGKRGGSLSSLPSFSQRWRSRTRLGGSATTTSSNGVPLNLRRALRLFYNALWTEKSSSGDDIDAYLSPAARSPWSPAPASSSSSSHRALSPLGWAVVVSLMLLGMREVLNQSLHARRVATKGHRPLSRLSKHPRRDLALYFAAASSTDDHAGQAKLWTRQEEDDDDVFNEEGDTTAIVLHYKRTDNVRLIAAHLCQYTFFKHVLVWNNNPDVTLTQRTFASAGCPAGVLRIHNSPKNMLFFARYLACSSASTANCFFQDDDWLVTSVRAMYAQFRQDPEGPIVVNTDIRTSGLYALEWCFFNQPMHACFAWLGTGAFVSKWQVSMFIATATALPFTKDELVHADNYFAIFQNEPPYVLTSVLSPLPITGGYSDGQGLKRNKEHIQRSISYISDLLNVTSVDLAPGPASGAPLYVYHDDMPIPLPPHPHAHHARHVEDDLTFITNVNMLPSPSALTYPGPDVVQLEEWENHLGHLARGWMEGTEVYREEEAWFTRWHYSNVFSSPTTGGGRQACWRSPDVVRKDDYFGLGLLSRIEIHWHPTVLVSWETADDGAMPVSYEISIDGYSWSEAKVVKATCEPTRQKVDRADPPFPPIHGLSPAASRIRTDPDQQFLQQQSTSGGGWTFLGMGGGSGQRWKRCEVVVDSSLGYSAGELGWQYFRTRAQESSESHGWAIRALSLSVL